MWADYPTNRKITQKLQILPFFKLQSQFETKISFMSFLHFLAYAFLVVSFQVYHQLEDCDIGAFRHYTLLKYN